MEHKWCIANREIRQFKKYNRPRPKVATLSGKCCTFILISLLACNSLFYKLLAGSILVMVWQTVTWYDPACMAMTLKCFIFNLNASIFQNFLGKECPRPPSISMLPMLIVLRTTITIILNSLFGRSTGQWLAWPLKNCFLRPWSGKYVLVSKSCHALSNHK